MKYETSSRMSHYFSSFMPSILSRSFEYQFVRMRAWWVSLMRLFHRQHPHKDCSSQETWTDCARHDLAGRFPPCRSTVFFCPYEMFNFVRCSPLLWNNKESLDLTFFALSMFSKRRPLHHYSRQHSLNVEELIKFYGGYASSFQLCYFFLSKVGWKVSNW